MQIFEAYHPHEGRYDNMEFYCRCGRSGLMLPRLSLGLWHNFGNITPFLTQGSHTLILQTTTGHRTEKQN